MKKETEANLIKELASYLTMPMFFVDTDGNLIYYNEPAESILGKKFKDTGEMSESVWSRIFIPTDENGVPLLPESLPLVIAIEEQRPAYRKFWISGMDNVRREIEVTAFPLIDRDKQRLGAIAIFWESKQ